MGHPRDMRILAISGSLRAESLNTRVLHFAARVALPGADLHLCDVLDRLPHFNPDLDMDWGPAAVVSFRAQLNAAAAVVISSPEYAHGLPGTLKNALDWVVGSRELVGNPLASGTFPLGLCTPMRHLLKRCERCRRSFCRRHVSHGQRPRQPKSKRIRNCHC
jgi:NAD(P)H-dependent FMN reductase